MRLHLVAGVVATLMVATFLAATIVVELLGSHEEIATVKALILSPGLFILVPALIVAGGSGFVLARSRQGRLVERKKRRLPIIVANGALLLLPSAILLARWAAAGSFDTTYYLVQAVELVVGSFNLVLMVMSIRDGLRISGRLRDPRAALS